MTRCLKMIRRSKSSLGVCW